MVLLDELENLSFLRHFAPPYLRQLASMAQVRDYPPDTEIFTEGQMERSIYLVLEGRVALQIRVPGHGTILVHTVGPGDLLGWSPVLGSGPMTATARAVGMCRVAALDAGQILTLAELNPKFGREFYRCTAAALAERLRATRLQIPEARHHELLALKEGSD